MDVECMEILDEGDVTGRGDSSGDEIYECDFDISQVVTETLANLDVRLQIHDAVSATSNTIDVLTTKYQATHDMFIRLEDQIKKMEVFTKQRLLLNSNMAHSLGPKVVQKPSPASIAKAVPLNFHQLIAAKAKPARGKMAEFSMDVIPLAKICASKPPQLPPSGPLVRMELTIGARIYAMKGSVFSVWHRGKIVDWKVSATGEKFYKVKYDTRKQVNQNLSGKHLAYSDPSSVMLAVGTRVIAQYRDEYFSLPNSMYAGIIAEPLKQVNKYRYLIFFDDGYAQYVSHHDVRVVCEANREVWEDVHRDSREFIKNYLMQYPERPMVKLQIGHVVKTEWNGKWWIAKVMEVDGSLVKMYFHSDRRTEWIYRGSTRLGPLYSELANAEAIRLSGKVSRRHYPALTNKKSAPYVEYTRGLDEPIVRPQMSTSGTQDSEDKRHGAHKHTSSLFLQQQLQQQQQQQQRSNVARKSTTLSPCVMKQALAPPSMENEGTFKMEKIDLKLDRRIFNAHNCGPMCLGGAVDDPLVHKGKSPLTIPMIFGWERQVAKHKSIIKQVIFYRAPCGRRLRDLEEIYQYLGMTESKLSIDLFCIDSFIHCFSEFIPAQIFCYIKDISYGKENVCVSGVNSLDREYPEYVEYSTKRIPNKGVILNLDPDFLVCCSCEDNCSDRSKCECQQLTVGATRAMPGGQCDPNAGYYFRRLRESVITGIYECNQRCTCSSQCLNRVAQLGLNLRLQVFKTEKRGWGIRCLDDIPKGGFVCTYAGQLLTEQGANEDGKQFGDEYLAELDYIEVVERMKEGYESDVVEPESDDGSSLSRSPRSKGGKARQKKGKKKNASSVTGAMDEEGEDEEDEEGCVSCDSSYSATEENVGHSSDSDFEMATGPVNPRPRSERQKEKVHKLVLRREASDQESNQSWSVSHGKEGDDGSSDLSSVAASKEGGDGSVSDKDSERGPVTGEKKDAEKKSTSSSPAAITIDSDSEADSNKSKKTPTDCNESMPKGGSANASSRNQSRFWTLPDPRKKEGSSKTKITGLTSEPGQRIKYQSVRSLFGDEFCYIMDAKSLGNIGRYLNHSCGPNVFVQNVFVDTHDVRFPWVAFFALQFIRAGTELTWDYNYEVGSVPNKALYCYCGASECRGRLL